MNVASVGKWGGWQARWCGGGACRAETHSRAGTTQPRHTDFIAILINIYDSILCTTRELHMTVRSAQLALTVI